jgi:hypothetical protein
MPRDGFHRVKTGPAFENFEIQNPRHSFALLIERHVAFHFPKKTAALTLRLSVGHGCLLRSVFPSIERRFWSRPKGIDAGDFVCAD